jgi:hypothetical protein
MRTDLLISVSLAALLTVAAVLNVTHPVESGRIVRAW